MKTVKPTRKTAIKVLDVLRHGLVRGIGKPRPGKMCVEAAVCYALGLPHSDNPPCVSRAVRAFKITLNDSPWRSNASRAAGLRRLAIAQLGSEKIDEVVFVKQLVLAAVRLIVPLALRAAAKVQRKKEHRAALEAEAKKCETAGGTCAEMKAAANAAYVAAYAAFEAAYAAFEAAMTAGRAAAFEAAMTARAAAKAWDAGRAAAAAGDSAAYVAAYAANVGDTDETPLLIMAEAGVQALIKCGSPGCKWLDLVPEEASHHALTKLRKERANE